MALLNKTALRNVKFVGCKMLGLQFDQCNQFNIEFMFDNCILNNCSFYGLKIKATIFKNCKLVEVDFTDCYAPSSLFDNCDFSGAIFENTNLEKSNLTSSFNFSIDPSMNNIYKSKFSAQNISGLLHKYKIEIEG